MTDFIGWETTADSFCDNGKEFEQMMKRLFMKFIMYGFYNLCAKLFIIYQFFKIKKQLLFIYAHWEDKHKYILYS